MIQTVLEQIRPDDFRILWIYIPLYFLWGVGMHNFGIKVKIARFRYWWQIIPCYVLYMIPVSLLLRDMPWHEQYVYGLFFMGIYEFGGYALKTSVVFKDNLLDRFFSPQNFSLAMTLFFASYFPLGNWVVEGLYRVIF